LAESSLTIGLLEDDPDQSALFSSWLSGAGFGCKVYAEAGEFRRRVASDPVDALILDWNLPDDEGITVLRWLREAGYRQLPVLFLTGRDDEADVVAGLSEGADDYLVKPPRQGELLARLQVLLRRIGLSEDTLSLEDISPYDIDSERRRLALRGEEIPLTDREFELAQYLFRRRGRVVSRESLLRHVWNIHNTVATRTVDTHVSRLRKKVELNGEHGWRLTAVYQHGYRLEQV
jgi:DNA-binding response OmpR family regulator